MVFFFAVLKRDALTLMMVQFAMLVCLQLDGCRLNAAVVGSVARIYNGKICTGKKGGPINQQQNGARILRTFANA